MANTDLITQYNYDAFTADKFVPWMRFDQSPALGVPGPDFQLWDLDEKETSLKEAISQNIFTIVEFGSFT